MKENWYREQKKGLTVIVFKNEQSKGKAMKKKQKALPKTPAKKIEVIILLVNSLSPQRKAVTITNQDKNVPYMVLSEYTKELYIVFIMTTLYLF